MARWLVCLLTVSIGVLAKGQSLTAPSNSIGSLPQPVSQQSLPARNLVQPQPGEQVVDPTQVKEVANRVGLLENERTWLIGLAAGLGIGIALVVWLRKDIVRTLVSEAFIDGTVPISGIAPKRWYPNKAQWIVTWIATTIVSPLFVLLPWSGNVSLRIVIAVIANAALFIVYFGDSGEAERSFRREAERHSGMIPNTIGA
jgi:hypothetical protein